MVFFLGIILTYILLEVKNKCFIKNTSKELLNNIIRKLIRQASRWSIASIQDDSPLISVLHANYGAGYLWALKDIAQDSEIESAVDINVKEFEKKIVGAQDKATKKMIKSCPDYQPQKNYLLKFSGQ